MDTLSLAWRSFHLPKKGNVAKEYEDAFAGDPARRRFAVADGASESAFAGAWAKILVRYYVRSPGSWSAWLRLARRRWRAHAQRNELPWYAEAKFQEGAFAALLGISFNKQQWLAEAVGDSCLFHVRDQRLLQAFPVLRSVDFGNRPLLLGSRSQHDSNSKIRRLRLQGATKEGDEFFLMTDALAEWFLKQVEKERCPAKTLQTIASQEEFVEWLGKLRSEGEIRNDDVTFICIQIKEA